MTTPLKLVLVATATLGAAGCAYEAGSQIDNGTFGNATMHNMLAQMCKGQGSGVKGAKSGVVTDPVVMLDPASTPSRPIYRVHCDGQLNGKYAQVIFREYIGSAVPAPQNATVATQTAADAASE
ncbi:hypothetical protein [Ovoidimarina sediminis]|uniref:hypothetical protein n=1 Tax=Ovoidimarina sediminis TaxID=3079856 RepID=UPI0029061F41|nr:hypothetical protein [Rhodophyticola sp. MJ-SS7]MDU8942952.1 hypothetical protein [Rhodophyticola sp. MJ-SS7]